MDFMVISSFIIFSSKFRIYLTTSLETYLCIIIIKCTHKNGQLCPTLSKTMDNLNDKSQLIDYNTRNPTNGQEI